MQAENQPHAPTLGTDRAGLPLFVRIPDRRGLVRHMDTAKEAELA